MTDDDKVRWSRLVSDWESTDLSQPEFARERGVSVHAFRYWLYRLRSRTYGVWQIRKMLKSYEDPERAGE